MVKFHADYLEAVENNQEPPRVTEFMGRCFLLIATRLINKNNFCGYRFKEDMIGDATIDCVRYAHKFDPNRYNNPFAYFTTVCFYAFVRRIESEKKYLYKKFKLINESEIFGLLHDSMDVDEKNIIHDIGYSESARENMMSFIETYEKKLEKK